MHQEKEIEFKNVVTQEEFQSLLNRFSISTSQFKKQINYYFDTPDFGLKEKNTALRVRKKGESYTLTVKQPKENYMLETHQPLTEEMFNEMIMNGGLPTGDVCQLLASLNIDVQQIQFLGELTTLRAEIPYEGGLLVFDESMYLGQTDYEIEYESTDYSKGNIIFKKLLADTGTPIKDTKNKIQRFFETKQSQSC